MKISHMVEVFLRNARENRSEYGPRHPAVKSLYGYTRQNPLPDKKTMREKLLRKHSA